MNKNALPAVDIVDMRGRTENGKSFHVFGAALYQAERWLEKGEQTADAK